MKNIIEDKKYVDFYDWKLSRLIEYLQSFSWDENAYITYEYDDCYICYSREETDEEYEARLREENEQRMKEEKEKVKRYKQYLKLKEEFEDKE